MKPSLAEIEAFVALAEQGSFKRASEVLNLSQPALSRRIVKLESTLGARLVERTTRAALLTAAGREFYQRARSILEDLELSLLSFQDQPHRRSALVTVACITSATQYLLSGAMDRFKEVMPHTRVRILDTSANEVLAAVLGGEADFGISFFGNSEPGLVFAPVQTDPFVLICRKDHPFASRPEVAWGDLTDHRLIALQKGSGNRLILDLELAESGLLLPWFYEVQHITTSLGFIEQGLGVAALPRSTLPRGEHPILTAVPLVAPAVSRTIGVLCREGVRMTSAAQAFHHLLLQLWLPDRWESVAAACSGHVISGSRSPVGDT
jgi:DNA-binding transcriptional LysR family regulator